MHLRQWPMLLLLLAAPVAGADAPAQPVANTADALTGTIAALDQTVFDAYNRCDLKKFGGYFVANVEFYHDHGGVTWSRREMVNNTRKYICGKVRRELVPGTLEVYPIKDFGAIEIGTHRFCELATGKCEGIARFTMIWRHQGNAWKITRVLSYDHRAAQP